MNFTNLLANLKTPMFCTTSLKQLTLPKLIQLSSRTSAMEQQLPSFGAPWPDLNDGILYADFVPSSSPPCTLLEFYCSKHKDSAPREGWLKRIQNRQITADGTVVTIPDATVRGGTRLVYHRLPWKEPPAPFKLEVLYEDDSILAVNKPSRLQVLSGGLFQQRTVLTQLKWRSMGLSANLTQKNCSNKQCSLQPSPVHRLGRGTSGVLLCAKSQAAKSKLASDFAANTSNHSCSVAKKRVTKKYRALVTGIICVNQISVSQPIGTVPYPGVSKGLYVASSTGKPSESKVFVLSRNEEDNNTLVEVEIYSGRPHQIRIHLAYLGHPLVGDPLYVSGGKPGSHTCLEFSDIFHGEGANLDDGGYKKPANAVPGDCGYHLHAHRLSFYHPITEKMLEIVATPPPLLCTPEEVELLQRSNSDFP